MWGFQKHTTIKTYIDDFIKSQKDITNRRASDFADLFKFVLDGAQWTASELKERDADKLPSLTFNFSEDFVERFMAKLFPRSAATGVLEVGAKVFDDEKGKYTREISQCYRDNYLPAIILEQGTNFLVGGAACFFYPQNHITKETEIISLDPTTVSLGWKGHRLVQMAYVETPDISKPREKEIHYCDLKRFVHIDKNGKEEIWKNKFDFIPFSWIPCYPKPHTHEGRSKVWSLYDLDREINFRASDYSKRILENTDPHLILYSEEAKKEDFKKGRSKISKLGKDDDARFLELKESPEVLEYIKELNARLRKKTGLVDASGTIKNAVSGLSLQYQYSDQMDLIGFMRIFWDKAFRELNNAILFYEFGEGDYNTDPIYNPAVQYDTKQKVEEYDVMLRNKIISRHDAIDELRTVENADEKIKEILAEDKIFQANEPEKIKKIGGGEND